MKYNLIIVPHTHWDREWYLPFQQFRIKLVDTLDKVISVLEKDNKFSYFTLDGQTIVLDDYLEVKPENKNRLKKLIRDKRLLIGPWYILPDEFLVSGESIIRNLIYGRKIGNNFGDVMQIGYLPDMFGHIAQMPQILCGFGFDCAVVWRGVPDKVNTSEFIWKALSGDEVLTIYLPDGYGNAAELPLEKNLLKERLEYIISYLKKFATTTYLLGMNGSDHLLPQSEIPSLLSELKNLDVNIEIGNLIEYKDNVLKEVDKSKIPTIFGELRSFDRCHLLVGVLSTRMYLKQKHFDVETLIEKIVEPLCSFSQIIGKKYPKNYVDIIWKYFLQNQPHDSICGCSIDEVHQEMMVRYASCEQIGEVLKNNSVNYIIEKINTTNAPHNADKSIVIFNLSQNERNDIVRISIPLFSVDKDIEIYDNFGNKVNYQEEVEYSKEAKSKNITFVANDIPGYGWTTYWLKFIKEKRYSTSNSSYRDIENEFFKISANKDGSLKVYDKKNKVTYPICNQFEDSGDVGDEYNYSPPEKDTIITKPFVSRCSVVENGSSLKTLKIISKYYIPQEISQNRKQRSKRKVRLTIVSYVSLMSGVPRIDFKCEVDNTAKDHRLRVNFVFPKSVREFTTDTQFGIIKRKTDIPQMKEGALEMPIGTVPQKLFTDISCDKFGLTLANKGLPEIEVTTEKDRTKISLTLLRCVEWLSRDDLKLRLGHAGPGLKTEEAQCLGKHIFEYSLIPHSGNFIKDKTHLLSQNFALPLICSISDVKDGSLPNRASFVDIKPDSIIVSAIKKCENDDALILRVYSISEKIEKGEIKFYNSFKNVLSVDLKEDIKDEKIKVLSSQEFTFEIKPYQIKTFKVEF